MSWISIIPKYTADLKINLNLRTVFVEPPVLQFPALLLGIYILCLLRELQMDNIHTRNVYVWIASGEIQIKLNTFCTYLHIKSYACTKIEHGNEEKNHKNPSCLLSTTLSVSGMFSHASIYQYPGAVQGNESTQKLRSSERRWLPSLFNGDTLH